MSRREFVVQLRRDDKPGSPKIILSGRGEPSPLTCELLSELFPDGSWSWVKSTSWRRRDRLEWTCVVDVAARRPRPAGWCNCGDPPECRCDPEDKVPSYVKQVEDAVSKLSACGIRFEL